MNEYLKSTPERVSDKETELAEARLSELKDLKNNMNEEKKIKKKGGLKTAWHFNGLSKWEVFYWDKLGKNKYLVIVPATFKKDPEKFKYVFRTKKQLLDLFKLCGHKDPDID